MTQNLQVPRKEPRVHLPWRGLRVSLAPGSGDLLTSFRVVGFRVQGLGLGEAFRASKTRYEINESCALLAFNLL